MSARAARVALLVSGLLVVGWYAISKEIATREALEDRALAVHDRVGLEREAEALTAEVEALRTRIGELEAELESEREAARSWRDRLSLPSRSPSLDARGLGLGTKFELAGSTAPEPVASSVTEYATPDGSMRVQLRGADGKSLPLDSPERIRVVEQLAALNEQKQRVRREYVRFRIATGQYQEVSEAELIAMREARARDGAKVYVEKRDGRFLAIEADESHLAEIAEIRAQVGALWRSVGATGVQMISWSKP